MNTTTFILRCMAPYAAVGIFWSMLGSGWGAILAYHVQVLLWLLVSPPPAGWRPPAAARALPWVLAPVLAGPLAWFLLPHIARTGLMEWLAAHRLSGASFALMVPYFGIVHPVLEQLHWAPLRGKTPLTHAAFAGYHVLVLWSLLGPAWLCVCFVLLTGASFLWREMSRRGGGLLMPVLSHVLADLGLVLAAFLRCREQ